MSSLPIRLDSVMDRRTVQEFFKNRFMIGNFIATIIELSLRYAFGNFFLLDKPKNKLCQKFVKRFLCSDEDPTSWFFLRTTVLV